MPKYKLIPITWILAIDEDGRYVPALSPDDYKSLGENMQRIKADKISANKVMQYYMDCNSK